jgi:undecaprenyl diphosphate synthase
MDFLSLPRHVAVIMDGNGRWAKKRKLRRIQGHRRGAEAVREIVTASREIGIKWLTLYAFSEENWSRPPAEIQGLMSLLQRFLREELDTMQRHKIRLQTIGRIEKLPTSTKETLIHVMRQTAHNQEMVLTLALSYGGRQEIADACRRLSMKVSEGSLSPNEISDELISRYLYTKDMPDPDLLIRTSGEFRVSNFLLWQIAYTEIHITPTLWPDFRKDEFLAAIGDYQQRERRFGAVRR